MRHEVFVTGGSGYLGAALIRALRRAQMIDALVRSIETPSRGIRTLDTRAIRSGSFA